MKTAQFIEEQNAAKSSPENTEPNTKKKRGNEAAIAPWKWKPGQSGNPGGRPKSDVAALLARAIFENNAEEAYKGLAKALVKGNAYVFKELAERGYGRLKEKVEVSASEEILKRLLAGRQRAKGK